MFLFFTIAFAFSIIANVPLAAETAEPKLVTNFHDTRSIHEDLVASQELITLGGMGKLKISPMGSGNLYDWQRRFQRVAVYLESQFKKGQVFKNLAHPDMPEHFMNVTKRYFSEINTPHAPIPQRAAITIAMIRKYYFSYVDTMY